MQNILTSIDELAVRGGLNRNRAFAAWYAITFHDVDEDDALEGASADGGNDQGIDHAFADDSKQEIVILQAYCPESTDKQTPKKKWDALTSSLPFIEKPKNLADSGRPDLAETLAELHREHPDYSLTVGLISLGRTSDAIERALNALSTGSHYKNISFFFYSGERISADYETIVNAEAGIPEDRLHFSGQFVEDNGDYGRSWVGSVDASELNRLYDHHKNNLFAGNIRLFLGARKGGINAQIIKTATDSPGLFWALNNGITIVADSASPTITSEYSALDLKRFSIVNGCQTTSSLVQAKAPASAKVLARVIAAKTGIKNDIVRFNNSQNAVKIWSVRAADDAQESLRRDFKENGITYAPKQEGSKRSRDASTIKLDKVTQYLASENNEYLIQAINNKSELFDEPYQKIYKKGIKATKVYLGWLLGNFSEQRRKDRAQALGEGDANVGLLGVTSVLWIIYCSFKLIDKFSDFNSPQITLKKMLAPEFESAIQKYVDEAIDMYYGAAIDTYDREEYGSFKSTLRSAKFLLKVDSKVNNKISRLDKNRLNIPNLLNVAKSIKE